MNAQTAHGVKVAAALLLLGLATAHAQTPDEVFLQNFRTGVQAQQNAAEGADATVRLRNLKQAEQAYLEALKARPNSIATLNNLGALYASTGADESARNYYRRAIATAESSKDPKLEGYALNYAEYLESRDPNEALSVANIALRAPNSGSETRALLGRLYAKADPAALIPFCRKLLDEGSTDQVLTLATEHARDLTRPADAHGDWLIMVAVAMARNTIGQASFDPRAITARLTPGSGSDPGISQLQRAVADPPESGRELSWWSSASSVRSTVGTSGRAAMLGLLRALGERYSRTNAALAARYYRAGIDLGARGPDPEAFLGLVNLYADTNDTESLRKIMQRYEGELFSEKGEAYARRDYPLILRLHTSLGMTYAHLNQWESREPFQNAQFQLEAAQRTVEQMNQRGTGTGGANTPPPEPVSLPKPAVQYLSDFYIRTGRGQLSTELRMKASVNLRAGGRTKESADVSNTIKEDEAQKAPEALRQLYERMERDKR